MFKISLQSANKHSDTGLDLPILKDGTLPHASGATRTMPELAALERLIAALQVPLGFCIQSGESSD